MSENPFLEENEENSDSGYDLSLRPPRFSDFVGQEKIKENLSVYIQAAKKRGDVLDHILFSGPPGLGKTTLAHIIAKELGVDLKATSGPVLEKAGDLAGVLTNLSHGDVLFIDEIHRLSPVVEEYLYSAMEDFSIDIVIDQGPSARSVRIDLSPFTLVGATTREGLLTAPLRSRFLVLEKLGFYPDTELAEIIKRSSRILDVSVEDKAAQQIAKRSRGTPRIANRFLRRIRDFAQVEESDLTDNIANEGLARLGVDEQGLGPVDRSIMKIIADHAGKPVGLKTLAVSVGETEDSIEDVYEPYLIQMGLLQKTPRGRILSEKGLKLIDVALPGNTQLEL